MPEQAVADERPSQYVNDYVSELLNQLLEDERQHELAYKKYKLCHRGLHLAKVLTNLLSVASHSTSLVSLATTVGVPISVVLSSIGLGSTAVNILCTEIDDIKIKKLKSHLHVVLLAKRTHAAVIKQSLYSDSQSIDDCNTIIELINAYFLEKSKFLNYSLMKLNKKQSEDK